MIQPMHSDPAKCVTEPGSHSMSVHQLSWCLVFCLQPRGNAMLVGVGGSGKQSLTRLAAHISGCKVFQIELNRSYGAAEFRADLVKLYRTTGISNESVVFLFSDTQIQQEGFLEDINNILNSGELTKQPAGQLWTFVRVVRPPKGGNLVPMAGAGVAAAAWAVHRSACANEVCPPNERWTIHDTHAVYGHDATLRCCMSPCLLCRRGARALCP